jgi:hypothetical protein
LRRLQALLLVPPALPLLLALLPPLQPALPLLLVPLPLLVPPRPVLQLLHPLPALLLLGVPCLPS